jgi:hypothetical protein
VSNGQTLPTIQGYPHHQGLMVWTEMTPEWLVLFDQLTQLIAREDLIKKHLINITGQSEHTGTTNIQRRTGCPVDLKFEVFKF